MYNVTASGALGVLFLHSFVAVIHWLEAALLLCCACALVCAVFGRAFVVTSCFSEFRHQLSSKFDLGESLADFDGFTRWLSAAKRNSPRKRRSNTAATMLQCRFNVVSALQCSFNAACFSVASMLLQRCLNAMSTPLQCRFNTVSKPLKRLAAPSTPVQCRYGQTYPKY